MIRKETSVDVCIENKSVFNQEESDFVYKTSPNKSASKRKQSNFTEGDQENMNPNKSFNFQLNYCKGKPKLKLPKISKHNRI